MSYETSTGANAGFSGGGFSSGDSTTTGWKERSVRFPNQVREEGARETMRAFVIPASGKSFTVQRMSYMELADLEAFDSPDFIADWEKRFGRRIE